MKKNAIILSIFMAILTFQEDIFAQKGKKVYNYPFGVQGYTFRKQFPKDLEGTLDIIQKMGFTELEGGGAKGVTPEEYKKLCDARGISIPSTGSDFLLSCTWI